MNGKDCMNKKKLGFTLVELLVVIAIIAMLLSILVPSLQKVREAAKKVKCATQQKQYGTGVYMYAIDNGNIPWFGLAVDTSNGQGGYDAVVWEKLQANMWYNVINQYMQGDAKLERNKNDKDKEVRETFADLRRCPSSKKGKVVEDAGIMRSPQVWIGVHYGGFPRAPFTYKYKEKIEDVALNGWKGTLNKSVRFDRIKQPADWLMLLDTVDNFVYSPLEKVFTRDVDGDGNKDSHIMGMEHFIYNRAQPRVHNDGMNVTLCDGHVEYVKFNDIWAWDNGRNEMVHSFWHQ